MSLINKMLQDLERRRASAAEHGAIPNSVRALPLESQRVRWPWVAGLVAAVTLAAIGVWAWMSLRAVPSEAPAVQVRPAPDRTTPALPPLASRLSGELAAVPPPPPDPALPVAPAQAPVTSPRPPSGPAVVAGPASPEPAPPQAAPKDTRVKEAPRGAAAADPVPLAASAAGAAIARAESDAVKSAEGAAPRPPLPAEQAAKAKRAPVKPTASQESAASGIDKKVREPTTGDLAENEYRRGATLLQQGDIAGAEEHFRVALQQQPSHQSARHALFGLMLEARRYVEAETLLTEGLRLNPGQPGFAMALARLQVERGDNMAGINTLRRSLSAAQNSPDYLAFLAALQQRVGRHGDAVENYSAALRMAPQAGVWWMGLAISLQALKRDADAKEAFNRAKASNSLNPELQAFVDQRLRQLQ